MSENIKTKEQFIVIPPRRWLTPKTFEEEFEVGYKAQEVWRKKGILPYSKMSGKVFYDRKLIDKVFEENTIREKF